MRIATVEKELKREIVVGVFAFAVVLGLFLFSIFITGDVFIGKKYVVRVLFADVMGLRVGDRVTSRGMTVGEVKRLHLVPGGDRVEVICNLESPLELRKGYEVSIEQTSILGGRLLNIEEGPANGAPIPPGTQLEGKAPYDLVKDAGQIVASVRDTMENKGMLEDFRQAVVQTRAIVEKINKGDGTLGKLVNDEGMYEDLKSAAASFKTIAGELEKGEGTLAKLINDKQLSSDMKDAVANLKELSQRLRDGKGLLGAMMAEDNDLAKETKLLVQDIRATVDDFREAAPILTFTSIFFGAL